MQSIFNRLFGKSSNKKEDTSSHKVDYYTQKDLDLIFADHFTLSGGYFNYEQSESDGLARLKDILQSLSPDLIYCSDTKLQKFLKQLSYKYSATDLSAADVFFSRAEALIALDGSIMFSYDQIKSKKISDLPENIVVWSNPDQLVANRSVGLEKIRRSKQNNIPSNITCVNGKKSQEYLKKEYLKELYLLLVEPIK